MATNYTPTNETANFGKFARIILDLCRDAAFQILAKEIPPADLPQKIRANLHLLKLSSEQLNKVLTKPAGVYPSSIDFDISALYTLLRNICPGISRPAQGWGFTPRPSETTVSDDVERIRQKRNILFGHANTAGLSDTVFKNELAEMKKIISRLDKYLGQNFLSGLCAIEGSSIDPEMQQVYSDRCLKLLKQDQETRALLDAFKTQQEKENTAIKDQQMGDQLRQKKTTKKVEELEVKQDQTTKMMEVFGGKQDQTTEKMEVLEGKQDQTTKKMEELEGKQDQTTEKIEELEGKQDQTTEKLEVFEGKQDQTTKKIENLEGKQDQTTEKIEELGGKQDQTTEKMEELEGKQDQTTEKLEVLEGKQDRTTKKIENLEGKQDQTTEKIEELGGKQDQTSKKMEVLEGKQDQTTEKMEELEGKQDQTTEKVEELGGKQDQTTEKMEELEGKQDQTTEKMEELEGKQDQTTEKMEELQEQQISSQQRQEAAMEKVEEEMATVRREVDDKVTGIQRQVETLRLGEDQTQAVLHSGKVKGSSSKFKKLKRRIISIFGRSKEMATVRRDVDDKVAGIQRQVETLSLGEDQTQTDLQQCRNEATLQRHMCAMYEEELFLQVTTIPLFGDIPLSEVFTPIIIREDLEAPLNLEARKSGGSRSAYIGQSSQINKKVQSYREMFQKDGKAQKNVYLLGKAGSGKTTFCRHLLDVWCKQSGGTAQYDNPETIHNFAFVFLVFCRHADTSGKVIDMIFDQLLTGLDNEYQSLVRHVLRTKPEKCLIIIDGLDEWAGSPSRSTGPGTPSGLPDRRGLENCVFLTTSRPWRIEALRQGVGKSYRIMEIQGLTDNGLKELARKVMKSEHESQSDQKVDVMVTDFISCVEKAKLGTVLETPLMIVNVLALWHDCKSLDKSMCVNYSQMIESLLLHAKGESDRSDSFNRLAGLTNLCSASRQDRPTLPQCFDSLPSSQLYAILIHKLARLAFERLFHTEKEKSLVFSMPELETYFQKSEIKAILKIGIFSLSAAYSKSRKRLSTVSFLHKTVQEFLAAVWMAVDRSGDSLSVFRKHCTCVTDVLDLSVFLAFLCGLSPEKGREVWWYIGELTASDPAVHEYRVEMREPYGYIYSSHPVPRLQQLLLQCTAEAMHHRPDMPLNCVIQAHNIQDVYVDSGISVENLDLLLGHAVGSDTGIKTLVMSDIKPSPEILETINRMVSLECLAIQSPRHNDPKQLCEVIFTAVNSLSPVKSLKLTWMSIAAPDRLFTVQLPQMLKSLTLWQVSITGRMSWPVAMETLYMSDVTLDHDSVLQLATWLQGSSSLQELCIEWLKCRDCGDRCRYQLDVTRHTRLHRLKLRLLSVDRVQVTPSNLETVVLWGLDKPGAAVSVISSLHLALQLTKLTVRGCRLSQSDIVRLCSVIPRLSQLVRLLLEDIDCDDLAVCVSDLSRSREIELSDVTMSDQAWSKFARSLPPTSHQLTVKLWHVNIDAATVSFIDASFTVTRDFDVSKWRPCHRDLHFHSREQT